MYPLFVLNIGAAMDYVLFTAVTFFILGFVVAILILPRVSATPSVPVDMQAMLNNQLQAMQLQNMLRAAQLEHAKQEEEAAILAVNRERRLLSARLGG